MNDQSWLACTSSFDSIPPGQSIYWCSSPFLRNAEIRRFSSPQGNIALQGAFKKNALLTRFVVEDGPLIKDQCEKSEFVEFFLNLATSLGKSALIELSSVSTYQPELELWLREAGFKRAILPVKCPLTYTVNCEAKLEQSLSSNWRHNYSRSLKHGLTFEAITEPNDKALSDFFNIYKETVELKQMSGSIDLDAVMAVRKEPGARLFFASQNNQRFSGRILIFGRKTAFDTLAATSAEGRKNYSSYFLMFNILQYCKENGIRSVDLGRIGPGKFDTVLNFKKGMGGELTSYLGDWVCSNQPVRELIFSAARSIKWRERW